MLDMRWAGLGIRDGGRLRPHCRKAVMGGRGSKESCDGREGFEETAGALPCVSVRTSIHMFTHMSMKMSIHRSTFDGRVPMAWRDEPAFPAAGTTVTRHNLA